ncbi:hypothetical protein CC78DRAFT_378815 [Lojkania enalia]|uniref:Uncharacterized protein n=1 Tax=Lojkania enalia TaxID=147567 RepID=A0A9P4KJI0_9PLEO|nr:hypothetical protein CC78DRAFT_378815 [Didymosphaeria enalia]
MGCSSPLAGDIAFLISFLVLSLCLIGSVSISINSPASGLSKLSLPTQQWTLPLSRILAIVRHAQAKLSRMVDECNRQTMPLCKLRMDRRPWSAQSTSHIKRISG